MRIRFLFPAIFSVCIFAACSSCRQHNAYQIDVSDVTVQLKTSRFDKEFFRLAGQPADSAYLQMLTLRNHYPGFFKFYVSEILGINFLNDTSRALSDSLLAFFQNPAYRAVFDTTIRAYDNVNDIDKQLTEGFKHYLYYFPEIKIPQVIYYFNGPRAFTYGDSMLAIGLDNYLGSDFWFYQIVQPQVPAFLARRLEKKYIVPNAMYVTATNIFPYIDNGRKLIDEMIYNGKIFYLLQHILPETADSLITGFSESQLRWLEENEGEIWKFYLKNNLLYETDPMVYKKFVYDAPATSGMPAEAPGNTGSWLGWRIVLKFMKENSDYTLQGLMHDEDAQKILSRSNYKP